MFADTCLSFRCARSLLETCSKSDLEIQNGFVSESESTYPVGKEARYKCKDGYVTEDGQTTGSIRCLQSGWSARPRCISKSFAPLASVTLVAAVQKLTVANSFGGEVGWGGYVGRITRSILRKNIYIYIYLLLKMRTSVFLSISLHCGTSHDLETR